MTRSTRLYLDNAATSFPKPPAVAEAMTRFLADVGASPGRGAYRESLEAGQALENCRARINRLIGGSDPNHVIFTLNCSDALNLGIKGVLKRGDHVITTDLDHNSILRPINRLASDGRITRTRVPCDPVTGRVDLDDVRRAIQPETRLLATLHGSNVTGTLQDIAGLGAIARAHDLLFLVDAAQTLGHIPLDVGAAHVDLLAAPGHKGLLGPLGTGFLYIRPGLERRMTTVREGGTGSASELDVQPDFLPDRFEPGSHNTVGIVGLSAAVDYILDRGIDDLHAREQAIMSTFLAQVRTAAPPELHLYGPPTAKDRCAVFSVRIDGFDRPQDLSDLLESEFGILSRSGLHCAPGAHATMGTAERGGTTRLSFGALNRIEDARRAAQALVQIVRTSAARV